MKYSRYLDLETLTKKKSVLLLGPRQTGKSTLVKNLFPHAVYENLADPATFRELSSRPELLRQRLTSTSDLLIIDEAQRIPEIFNEVQIILDRDPSMRVIITGSSARKLKRSDINLLPGRIWKRELFPLVYPELGSPRIEERVIKGSLPGIIDNTDYRIELKNYVDLYLDEEVRAEGLTRGIGDFARFLPVAALCNAEQLNFSNVSNDTGIVLNTVRSYFEILEDTLIGRRLPPFRKTKTRKAVATPKFYFFDCGVVNALLNRFDVSPESDIFGKALEHLVYQELLAFLAYTNDDRELTYWRSRSKHEVDFLIGGNIALEVKAKQRITERDEKGLHILSEEVKLKRRIIVCKETRYRKSESGVDIFPVEEFLSQLWGKLLF